MQSFNFIIYRKLFSGPLNIELVKKLFNRHEFSQNPMIIKNVGNMILQYFFSKNC